MGGSTTKQVVIVFLLNFSEFDNSRIGAGLHMYMHVSKNRGTPNGWFIMENLIKMDD